MLPRLLRTARGRVLARVGAAAVGAAASVPAFALADSAPATASSEAAKELQLQLTIEHDGLEISPPHLSIREIREGNGAVVEPGMWVHAHAVVTLVGDGTVVEDTRTSGKGDRDYGEPLCFQLGDLSSDNVLRALHPTILDMRAGGCRRVRTNLLNKNWGYRELPRLFQKRIPQKRSPSLINVGERHAQGDWLMDVAIEVIDVSHKRPPSPVEQMMGATVSGWMRTLRGE